MKLAFSTNAFTRFSLQEALRGIKAAGFEGVEIIADSPHAYPDSLDEQTLAAIRHELEDLSLAVSNINANCTFGYWRHAPPEPYFEPSLISPVEEYRRDRIRLLLKTLQFAKAVGAANMSITTGRMLGGMPPQAAARQFAESIRPILDRADELGIDVGIECEPGLMIEYVSELREWIDRIGHRRFGANLDIGHSQVMGENVGQVVRELAGRIWNMHIEDIPGRKHYHLVPGEGTLDWTGFKEALVATGYKRFLTVELYTYNASPHEAAQRSFEFLKGRFGG